MNARETIFSTIRAALAPLKERTVYPDYAPAIVEPKWLGEKPDDAALFRERLTATGGFFWDQIEDCAIWLEQEKAGLIYVAAELYSLASQLGGRFRVTRDYDRSLVDQVDVAFTRGAAAIAESGSVILTDHTTPDRLAALAPWRHIAVVRRCELVRTIGEAILKMPADANVIWVTGPSKTADVEGILIKGVHGPGQQGCLLID